MSKLVERINKITKPYKMLTVFVFLDQLGQSNPTFEFPSNINFSSLRNGSSKDELILGNIVRYYHYFLTCNNAQKQIKSNIQIDELSQLLG